CAFVRAAPSTRTPPDPSRRSAAAREPISGSDARKRSSRSPTALSGTRCFTHARRARGALIDGDQREEEHRHADDDESVGEVERRPEPEVEEVRDMAQTHAVDEV